MLFLFSANYIKNAKPKALVLGCVALSASHTGQNMANAISQVLESVNKPITHVVQIVTDGASNAKKMVEVLGYEHLHCAAHCLQLVSFCSVACLLCLDLRFSDCLF